MSAIGSVGATMEPPDRVLVITRVFDAPRSLVYGAWTAPERLAQWWGPHGFTVLSCKADVRVGGGWCVRIRSPEGSEHASSGIYREIVPLERLVFTHAWEGTEDGEPGHETLVTINFAEQSGKTRMAFQQSVFTSVSARDAHEVGWSESFELLVGYLDSQQGRAR
jgi:uncharacterized protein YndB with AHSA1/START domain